MRRIGTLPDAQSAESFCDYLVTRSIDAKADQSDGGWDIWIRDEEDVDKARQEFTSFLSDPHDPRYDVGDEVARIREQRIAEHQERIERQRRAVESMPESSGGRTLASAPVKQQKIPITIAIIVASILASLASDFGPSPNRQRQLSDFQLRVYLALSFVDIRDYAASAVDPNAIEQVVKGQKFEELNAKPDPFASIRKGEIWRLVTPMFLHGDQFHLAFNMLWMFFLGSAIERLHGSWFLLALVLGTHIAGMMLQVSLPDADSLPTFLHALSGSPFAIGASGAVYGLFGFLWIRPMVDPSYPIRMVPMNVVLMLGWLVVCMTPLIGNVANGAHLGGLAAGMLAAAVGPLIRRR